MMGNSDTTPADKRRPGPTDSVTSHLKFYFWALTQYLAVFTVASVAMVASVALIGVGRSVLVPQPLPEQTFGLVTGVWFFASLFLVIKWCKIQMAKRGFDD